MADYTVMGAGPAENLLLLSRTVSLEPETGDTRSSMMRTRYGRMFQMLVQMLLSLLKMIV